MNNFEALGTLNEYAHHISFDIETVSYVAVPEYKPTVKDIYEKTDQFELQCMQVLVPMYQELFTLNTHNYKGVLCWSHGEVTDVRNKYEDRARAFFGEREGKAMFSLIDASMQDRNCRFYLKPAGCKMILGSFMVVPISVGNTLSNDELIDYQKTLPCTKSLDVEFVADGVKRTDGIHIVTTIEQVSEFLSNWETYSIAHKATQLLTAHNVNYEWMECLRHTKYFCDVTNEERYTVLRGDGKDQIKSVDVYETAEAAMSRDLPPSKDSVFVAPILSIRDSKKFSEGSLKKAGEKYGISKLIPGDLDVSYNTYFSAQRMQEEINSYVAGEECTGEESHRYRNWIVYNIRDTAIPICIMADSVLREMRYTCTNERYKNPGFPVSPNHANKNRMNKESANKFPVLPADGTTQHVFYVPSKEKAEELNRANGKLKKGKKVKSVNESFRDHCKYINRGTKLIPGKITDSFFLNVLKPVAGGGLVGINPYSTGVTYEATLNGTIIRTAPDGKKCIKGSSSSGIEYELMHIDLNSAHPSQAFKRYFPNMERCRLVDVCELAGLHDNLLESMEKTIPGILNNPETPFTRIMPESATIDIPYQYVVKGKVHTYGENRAINYSGLGTFKLTNVHIKIFETPNGKCCIPCMDVPSGVQGTSGDDMKALMRKCLISYANCAKSIREVRYAVDDGITLTPDKVHSLRGKIYNTYEEDIPEKGQYKTVKIQCSFEELITYSMFYDFEFEVESAYVYDMKMIPEKIAIDLSGYARKKVTYKDITKMFDEGTGKLKCTKKETYTEDDFRRFLEDHKSDLLSSDYEYGMKEIGNKTFWDAALKKIKGIFNGIYGMNYQSMCKTQIKWNVVDGKICEEIIPSEIDGKTYPFTFQNTGSRDYAVSMYIALWSYVDLALHLRYVLDHGGTPLYWATDSIFCVVPKGLKVKNLFNTRTTKLEQFRPLDSSITWGKDLGGMDVENYSKKEGKSKIHKFITTACLKNALLKRGAVGVHKDLITFSGCDKEVFFGDLIVSEEGDNVFYDFDKVAERMTEPNYYVSSKENKKCTKQYASDGTFLLWNQGYLNNDTSSSEVCMMFMISESEF